MMHALRGRRPTLQPPGGAGKFDGLLG